MVTSLLHLPSLRSGDSPMRRRSLLGLFALVSTYRLLIGGLYVRHLDLIGDERYYVRVAKRTGRFLKGRVTWDDALNIMTARAWFMPGTGIHAMPAEYFTDRVDYVRMWMGVMDLGFLFVATGLVARRFGRKFAAVFLLLIGLWPSTAVSSFTLWGESHGSLLLLISFLLLVEVSDKLDTWRPLTIALGAVGVGVILGWAVYLRPPFAVQLLAVVIVVIVTVFGRRGVSWGRAALLLLAIPAAIAVILPWSIAASDKVGGTVFTTVTFNVNLIHAFLSLIHI